MDDPLAMSQVQVTTVILNCQNLDENDSNMSEYRQTFNKFMNNSEKEITLHY